MRPSRNKIIITLGIFSFCSLLIYDRQVNKMASSDVLYNISKKAVVRVKENATIYINKTTPSLSTIYINNTTPGLPTTRLTTRIPINHHINQQIFELNTTWSPESGRPFMTMFTTFKNTSDRFYMQSNVVKNWALLKPAVELILFTNDMRSNLTLLAKKYGWNILPITRSNSHGTPCLKDMFTEAWTNSKTPVHAYCNGDILFDEGVYRTTLAALKSFNQSIPMLIVGRRTNVMINPNDSTPLYNFTDVRKKSKSGYLFTVDAEDYFIMSNAEQFPWTKMKDVVIGRPAYDNYLVGTAILSNRTIVIDGTKTILAFHQTGKDGKYAGAKNKDGRYNANLIGRFNYNLGITTRTQYEARHQNNEIIFFNRKSKR